MPKSKKPAGGRAAKNFDPRYGAEKTPYQERKRRPGESSAGKPGSKSPSHRGYRAETDAAPKRRWTAQEKAGRDAARGIRTHAHGDRSTTSRSLSERSETKGSASSRGYAARSASGWDRTRAERSRTDRPSRSRTDRPSRSHSERPSRSHSERIASSRSLSERSESKGRTPGRSDWSRSAADTQRADVVHERLQAQAVRAEAVADVTFASLGLGDNIVRALSDLGAETPFPIQAATITPIIEGRDVLARGRTGSGKTIAFGAPLVESILRSQTGKKREFGRAPKALILAPTRELALQIDRTIQPIARSVGLFTTQIYGGVPQGRQVGALKKGVDIVIGTPGRIEDLVEQGKLDLSGIRIAVLDEADHMCELGFLEPVQRILRLTAADSQKLLFSATLDREVAALVDEFLVEPAVFEVAGEDQDSSTIDHRVLVIDHRDKAEILASLVAREGKTLVFARTRAYTEMLAEQFDDAGIRALALHGDLNQAKRTRNLERLTSGRVQVLVATDVAARGIHVDDIDLVVQADAPDEYKTYLHRSGRTGRAGRAGTVVTLIPRQRRRRMAELLDRAEIDAPFDEVRPGDDILEELSGRQVDPVA
jgi:superfamily II DNA/RNA helicase